jgi:hypothetical protein
MTCYNIVHWIFAVKYWALSFKVKQLKEGRNPDTYNKLFMTLFITGIILNFVSAMIGNLSQSLKLDKKAKQLTIAALVLTAPLYVSFATLIDAFRRFKNTKSPEQIIKNLNVFALSFAFLIYAIGVTIVLLIQLKIDSNPT